jgi:hypothetical protein
MLLLSSTPINFRVATHVQQCHVVIISALHENNPKVMIGGKGALSGHSSNEAVIAERSIERIFPKQFNRAQNGDLAGGRELSE